jgi:Uma2 family endonuclease
MTIAVEKPVAPKRPEAGEAILLHNVSWETYEALLKDLDEQHLRLTYDNGRLAIVSPLPKHDKVKKLVGRMIEHMSFELDIVVSSFGSTTWKSRKLRKGLEADEC